MKWFQHSETITKTTNVAVRNKKPKTILESLRWAGKLMVEQTLTAYLFFGKRSESGVTK